jgi:pyruvate,orthophosphate dikinase
VPPGLDTEADVGTGELDVAEGDPISVDGDRGLVARGALPTTPAEDDPTIKRFLEWHHDHRS